MKTCFVSRCLNETGYCFYHALTVGNHIVSISYIHGWRVRWGWRTVNRGDGGSIPPTAVSKLRQFRLPHICLCLSEDTLSLKAGGPFYLVSMPGEVKDPTQGVNV